MKIVIDIPDEDYMFIKDLQSYHSGRRSGKTIERNVINGIKNGKPLPKGHGDLKDVNQLLEMTESYKSELGRFKVDPFVKCGIETVESFIEELPTIIEADKEVENEADKEEV